MGAGYTHALNRTVNRNVAIALFLQQRYYCRPSSKLRVGAASGDDQINWITKGTAELLCPCRRFRHSNALVTWEEIADPSAISSPWGAVAHSALVFSAC